MYVRVQHLFFQWLPFRLAQLVPVKQDFTVQGNGSIPKYVGTILYFHKGNINIIFRDTHWHPLM